MTVGMHKLRKDNSSEYNFTCLIEVLQLHVRKSAIRNFFSVVYNDQSDQLWNIIFFHVSHYQIAGVLFNAVSTYNPKVPVLPDRRKE